MNTDSLALFEKNKVLFVLVNEDPEVGAEFTLNIASKTTDKAEKSFLPTVSGNKYSIPFLLGDNDK